VLGKLGSDDEGTIMEDMEIGSIYNVGDSSDEERASAAIQPTMVNSPEPSAESMEIDERVSCRVDELMRSLQESTGLLGLDLENEEDDFGFYDEE
jgi:hypothetical protein